MILQRHRDYFKTIGKIEIDMKKRRVILPDGGIRFLREEGSSFFRGTGEELLKKENLLFAAAAFCALGRGYLSPTAFVVYSQRENETPVLWDVPEVRACLSRRKKKYSVTGEKGLLLIGPGDLGTKRLENAFKERRSVIYVGPFADGFTALTGRNALPREFFMKRV